MIFRLFGHFIIFLHLSVFAVSYLVLVLDGSYCCYFRPSAAMIMCCSFTISLHALLLDGLERITRVPLFLLINLLYS